MRRLPDGRIAFDSPAEVPPVAMSLGSTAWNRTGDWRSREPRFRDLTPPCAAACPAAQDVVDQVRLVAQGRIRDAGEVVLAANPFPATTGRVCPHPCTAACNRGRMDGSVDVPGVERALGDALLADGFALPRAAGRGGRVAVIGAGPAGLTAAHFLALGGHDVRLLDRDPLPGGLLRTGIPPYRLPRRVLDGEIARALRPGVRFEGGRALGAGLDLAPLSREHDLVLVALGRHAPRALGVPGEGAEGVVDGLALLAALHRGAPAPAGRRAVVVGGGNTAVDCARSLRRRGLEAVIAYRRGASDMPAFADEVEEAREEGIEIEEWVIPAEVRAEGGRVRGVAFARARPGPPDASGRPRPVAVPGTELVLDADLVVVAAGESLDAAGLPVEWVRAGELAPADGRVMALGDCAGGGGTVAHAIGAGRRAAAAAAARLGGGAPSVDLLAERGAAPAVAGFEHVRPSWFRPAPGVPRGREDAAERRGDDREVRRGLGPGAARDEAARCLSCGTCAGCDVCLHLCPERAVRRGAPGAYGMDAARCKGCGVCVQECPRGAVELVELGGA